MGNHGSDDEALRRMCEIGGGVKSAQGLRSNPFDSAPSSKTTKPMQRTLELTPADEGNANFG